MGEPGTSPYGPSLRPCRVRVRGAAATKTAACEPWCRLGTGWRLGMAWCVGTGRRTSGCPGPGRCSAGPRGSCRRWARWRRRSPPRPPSPGSQCRSQGFPTLTLWGTFVLGERRQACEAAPRHRRLARRALDVATRACVRQRRAATAPQLPGRACAGEARGKQKKALPKRGRAPCGWGPRCAGSQPSC